MLVSLFLGLTAGNPCPNNVLLHTDLSALNLLQNTSLERKSSVMLTNFGSITSTEEPLIIELVDLLKKNSTECSAIPPDLLKFAASFQQENIMEGWAEAFCVDKKDPNGASKIKGVPASYFAGWQGTRVSTDELNKFIYDTVWMMRDLDSKKDQEIKIFQTCKDVIKAVEYVTGLGSSFALDKDWFGKRLNQERTQHVLAASSLSVLYADKLHDDPMLRNTPKVRAIVRYWDKLLATAQQGEQFTDASHPLCFRLMSTWAEEYPPAKYPFFWAAWRRVMHAESNRPALSDTVRPEQVLFAEFNATIALHNAKAAAVQRIDPWVLEEEMPGKWKSSALEHLVGQLLDDIIDVEEDFHAGSATSITSLWKPGMPMDNQMCLALRMLYGRSGSSGQASGKDDSVVRVEAGSAAFEYQNKYLAAMAILYILQKPHLFSASLVQNVKQGMGSSNSTAPSISLNKKMDPQAHLKFTIAPLPNQGAPTYQSFHARVPDKGGAEVGSFWTTGLVTGEHLPRTVEDRSLSY